MIVTGVYTSMDTFIYQFNHLKIIFVGFVKGLYN
jgi:hypothetical protein